MKIPEPLIEWLTEKVGNNRWAGVREERKITHRWTLHTGGRVMTAALTASVKPADEFSLDIDAKDIEPEYINGAKNGALTVLLSRSSTPVLKLQLKLFDFQPDMDDSSYAAFYHVSKEATEKLLGVFPDTKHNIIW